MTNEPRMARYTHWIERYGFRAYLLDEGKPGMRDIMLWASAWRGEQQPGVRLTAFDDGYRDWAALFEGVEPVPGGSATMQVIE